MFKFRKRVFEQNELNLWVILALCNVFLQQIIILGFCEILSQEFFYRERYHLKISIVNVYGKYRSTNARLV